MKLRFKAQPYQTDAVRDVVDCFIGQPMVSPPGLRGALDEGYRNADIALSDLQILENLHAVQQRQTLPLSQSLTDFRTIDGSGALVPAKPAYKTQALAASRLHLDVEMETGTGKTYCYIKTIFEMNQRYGWSKFIIMVPSIAIREGVCKSLDITAEHFNESYGKKARFFVYNSRRLHELESFSSDAGINVMVINIQAFNARGAENRRIYEELDDFQSRRPIDVIAATRPILILDEPQKMEGRATTEALPKFRPLFILRYSATHRTLHNRVHRLDALDAYNRKLVKKIAVRGIQTRGLAGTSAYFFLEGIDISAKSPVARIEIEVKLASGVIKRRVRRLAVGDDLRAASGGLDQYRGFTVSQIDAVGDRVEFTNGVMLATGEAHGDVSETDIRRIQIRETIKAHLEKEKQLFAKGIKVLSLFFIDEVVKYRDYARPDERGEYAHIFEEEYDLLTAEHLSDPNGDDTYRAFLSGIDAAATHKGYFSIDRKTNRLRDPKVGVRAVHSDDVDAYDLILRDKERLLSFAEPTRFIFSHSALREGWDNPNVFVMCMLKRSDNTLSRRQEVGRGLRLAVDQSGERADHPALVHDINVLTVVANESYADFVAGLQTEIAETLSSRPRAATEAYFTGMTLSTDAGSVEVTPLMARQIYRYLLKHDYTDDADRITEAYHAARLAGTLAALPDDLTPYAEPVFQLIDTVSSDARLPDVTDGRATRTNPLNANFETSEFQELWARINRKAVYRVAFETDELIRNSVAALNRELRVTPLQYTVRTGMQENDLTDAHLRGGEGFTVTGRTTERAAPLQSRVRYDLVGQVAQNARLTRATAAKILSRVEPAVFDQFKTNPEQFITAATRLISEQKAAAVIERLTYDALDERYDADIFTANQTGQDFSRATGKLAKHIHDYAITESAVERDFVHALDKSHEVVVYAKLPRGFLIPTPVGDYNPDWAISFRSGSVRHIYFVAETKGKLSSLELREIESTKIACARKFFDEIGKRMTTDRVRYDVVRGFDELMDLVG